MLSLGVAKTRLRALVNATSPRLGMRWPPVLDNDWTKNSRISEASSSSCARESFLRSAGELIFASKLIGSTLRSLLHRNDGHRACNPPYAAYPMLGLLSRQATSWRRTYCRIPPWR